MKAIDLTGHRFGRLVVTGAADPFISPHGRARGVSALCDCGIAVRVRVTNLTSGDTQSCGCLMRERAASAARTHGMSRTKTYRIWQRMLARCASASNPYYGGRGITVCERWKTFENFFADMGEAPNAMSVDRKDTNGNYEPDNCRWATQAEQSRNTRRTIKISYGGQTMCFKEWCTFLGVPYGTAKRRLDLNWGHLRALGLEDPELHAIQLCRVLPTKSKAAA